MESALPRWQEGSPLAFCQHEGGMMVVVVVVWDEGGLHSGREKGREKARGLSTALDNSCPGHC